MPSHCNNPERATRELLNTEPPVRDASLATNRARRTSLETTSYAISRERGTPFACFETMVFTIGGEKIFPVLTVYTPSLSRFTRNSLRKVFNNSRVILSICSSKRSEQSAQRVTHGDLKPTIPAFINGSKGLRATACSMNRSSLALVARPIKATSEETKSVSHILSARSPKLFAMRSAADIRQSNVEHPDSDNKSKAPCIWTWNFSTSLTSCRPIFSTSNANDWSLKSFSAVRRRLRVPSHPCPSYRSSQIISSAGGTPGRSSRWAEVIEPYK